MTEFNTLLPLAGSSWASANLSVNLNAKSETNFHEFRSDLTPAQQTGSNIMNEMENDVKVLPLPDTNTEPQIVELTDKEINEILVGLIADLEKPTVEDTAVQPLDEKSSADGNLDMIDEEKPKHEESDARKLKMSVDPKSAEPRNIALQDRPDNQNHGSANAKTQCYNCKDIFTAVDFDDHLCDYDSDHLYIDDSIDTNDSEVPQQSASSTGVDQTVYLSKIQSEQTALAMKENRAINICETNNLTIQTWLKLDCKITTNAVEVPSKKHEGPHCCKKCDRKFVHASGLSRHMEKHDHDKSAGSAWSLAMNHDSGAPASLEMATKCSRCQCAFRRADDCLKHIHTDHEIDRQINEDMDYSDNELVPFGDADEHSEIEVSNLLKEDNVDDCPQVVLVSSVLRCEFCEFIFTTVDALLDHSSTHDPRNGYECIGCEIRSPSVREMSTHWFMECPVALFEVARKLLVQYYFVCNVCEHKFTTPAQLYDHRRTSFHLYPRVSKGDQNEILIACEECGKLFDSAKAMVVHQQEEHQTKVRTATKRNDASSKADKLTAGATGFTESSKYRQYLCDVCGKSYTQSSHLWQHLRFHKGVKPFACKEPNCTRRFTIRPDLNDHIRKCHTGERPYHCQICGKRFLTGSVFYQHRLIHRGERRYGCDDCGKRFYRADALKNHQRIHTGEKPYACTQCQKTFRQRGDRDKHIRARHSGVLAVKDGMKMGTAVLAMAGAMGRGRIRCKKDLLLQRPPVPRMHLPFGMGSTGMAVRERSDPATGEVVYVGSMAFPTSMFQPVVSDIDASANLY